MNWNGKEYKLIPILDERAGPLCGGCAFEDEAFNDPDGGCWNAGRGCIEPGFVGIWQEVVSQ